MSDWKCTGECRWVLRPTNTATYQVLQQLWENAPYKTEWRDVPVVEEPEHE
jgi:hypothetical protein